jgi:predicted RNA-binding protein with PUA-like domain
MARWLAKSEPSVYSYADLVRDRTTEWDGVHNATALIHLRAMRRGDELLFYHSGDERSVVGIARITGAPRPDPKDDRGSWSVAVAPVRALRGPVPLAVLRAEPALNGFILFRISRLSVMPVSDAQWRAILAHEPEAGATAPTVARPGRARASGSRRRGTGARRRR